MRVGRERERDNERERERGRERGRERETEREREREGKREREREREKERERSHDAWLQLLPQEMSLSTLQHIDTLQHTWHTATHCNTLHTGTTH